MDVSKQATQSYLALPVDLAKLYMGKIVFVSASTALPPSPSMSKHVQANGLMHDRVLDPIT